MELPRFLSTKEAAKELNLPLVSVQKLCRQGRLPIVASVKPYRIITERLFKNEN